MSDAILIDVHHPHPFYAAAPSRPRSPPPPPLHTQPPHPFRQHALWAASALLFSSYLFLVLYIFLTSEPFRLFIVSRANALFAIPYVLSLLVVLLCLSPCTQPATRSHLDVSISSPADCCLIILVLLEWATCLALVLVTLIAVHDGLSYVSSDGLIVPVVSGVPDDAKPADGIADDAVIVLIIPVLLMYTLFNFLLHCFSAVQASWLMRNSSPDPV